MSQTNTAKGNITIYGLGGAGCNIASMFEELRNSSEVGMADVNPVYVDTSGSNMKPGMDPKSFFRFEDPNGDGEVDGSGGIRATNAALIQQQIPMLLEKHRPGYATIVVSSASGGSGSVISPLLVRELVERGTKLLVVITIGDDATNTRIQNTLNTIAGFEMICEDTQSTIALAYFQNTEKKQRVDVDGDVFELVGKLSALFSRQNAEMDTMDLVNFLSVENSKAYPPHLVRLETFSGELTEATAGDGIATVASLQRDRETNPVKMRVEHMCTGFVPTGASSLVNQALPLHFTTRAYAFNDLAATLRGHLDDLANRRKARIVSSTVTKGVTKSSLGIPL